MIDPTEPIRHAHLAEINAHPAGRDGLEAIYGRAWDPKEFARDFDVLGFMAPYVVVRRKSDGCKGSLAFQHDPRFYFLYRDDPA
jgi:hypothetical protein